MENTENDHIENLPSLPDHNTPVRIPSAEDIVQQFLADRDVRESSKESYERSLKVYFEWVVTYSKPLSQLTLPDLLKYKSDLLARGLGANTVSSYLIAVRLLYEWLESKRMSPNIAKGLKSPRSSKSFKKMPLTAEQATQLLNYFKNAINAAGTNKPLCLSAMRDFAIVNLLLRTGLREMEPLAANIDNISARGAKRVLYVRSKGKDGKEDYVVLTDKAYGPISDYLGDRGAVPIGSPLFASSSNNNAGGRVSTGHVRRIVKEGLRAIGLNGKEYSTHSLRHFCATMIIEASGKVESAQWVLRHANPATTMIYGAMAKEKIRLEEPPEELLDSII